MTTDSAFWRSLEAQFRNLQPQHDKTLWAQWSSTPNSAGEQWDLRGADPLLQAKFERLAKLAAVGLGHSDGPSAVCVWLDRLKRDIPLRDVRYAVGSVNPTRLEGTEVGEVLARLAAEMQARGGAVLPDGSITEETEFGSIYRVCEESAECCGALACEAAVGSVSPEGPECPDGKGASPAPPATVANGEQRYEPPSIQRIAEARMGYAPDGTAAPPGGEKKAPELNVVLIKAWMDDEGWTNETLAQKLRISERAISSMRNNGEYHGSDAVTKLANLMVRDIADLYLP